MYLILIGEVTFDLEPRSARREPPSTPEIQACDEVKVNPDICNKLNPPQSWEIDVRQLISTASWLMTYGLRKNRLDMKGLLPVIGFKHADG